MFKNLGITNATLAYLSGLKKLRSLILDGTGVTGEGLAGLASAGQLERLSLSVGVISSEGMAPVARLTSLKAFEIWWDKIKDEDLVHLKGPTQLERIDMNSCGITVDGLANLPKLKELPIAGCRSPAVLAFVRTMPALEILIVNVTMATEAEFAALQAAKPKLKIHR